MLCVCNWVKTLPYLYIWKQMCTFVRYWHKLCDRMSETTWWIHLKIAVCYIRTKLKNNMKGGLRSIYDRILLRKRAIVETLNDELKNIAQIEHSRHRPFPNFIINLIGGIAAYCLFPKKSMINLERIFDNQLTLFWLFSSNSR